MLELVKTNPDFQYAVSINGNLTGQGDTMGQYDFHFNQKNQKVEWNKSFNDEYAILDIDSLHKSLKEGDKRFDVYDWKNSQGKEFRHYIWRLAFNGRKENKFTTDLRPGVHISTALRVLKDQKIFNELGEQKLKEYLAKDTSESRKFFGEFLSKCNQEFIPDYWNFVLNQIKK